MFNNILLFSVLLLTNSCNSSKSTVSNSSTENQEIEIITSDEFTKIKEKEEKFITKDTSILLEQKATEIKKNNGFSEETPVDIMDKIEEDTKEKIVEPITMLKHNVWNNLLQKHVSNQGNVNYKGFKTDHTALKNYIKSLSENTPTETWTKAEKMAYWINAYNALTIDLIVKHYPIKSIKDINNPWEQRLWKLGDKWYNLEDIEHQILRKMNEPRIHFGIVCASVSCPKLQNTAFEASKLEEQLTTATKEFLADTRKNNLSKNNIKISKIFKWFSSDFKENGSLVDFINKYSEIVISQNASKSYKDYNWNLNE